MLVSLQQFPVHVCYSYSCSYSFCPDILHSHHAREHTQQFMIHACSARFLTIALVDTFQIPNPLFDLAGITCGHFLVPFWTFFGATLIGKAIVKMHIQVWTSLLLSMSVCSSTSKMQLNSTYFMSKRDACGLQTNCILEQLVITETVSFPQNHTVLEATICIYDSVASLII